MEIEYWWLIAAIVLFLAELLTASFGIICISIAALGGAIAAFCDLSLEWQFLIFAITAILTLIFVRPLLLKMMKVQETKHLSNTDALIGRTARVDEPISNSANTGRVLIDGDNWRARTAENIDTIVTGAMVEIVKVNNNTLIVKPI